MSLAPACDGCRRGWSDNDAGRSGAGARREDDVIAGGADVTAIACLEEGEQQEDEDQRDGEHEQPGRDARERSSPSEAGARAT